MTTIANSLMLLGGFIAILAGVGVLRFSTPYARFHAAGKASPVAFLVAGVGAAIELGASGAAHLVIAGGAMVLTVPVGVHLLFRAVHRTSNNAHLVIDELAPAERVSKQLATDPHQRRQK